MFCGYSWPRVLSRAASLAVVLALPAAPALAQVVWDMPTEYPATAIPGEGLTFFAGAVEKRLSGKLVIRPSFNAERGFKSGDMPAAVAEGKIAAADAFGGGLGNVHVAFALSSLPFLTASYEDARRLAEAGRPLYEEAMTGKGLKFLYVTPWPPSGIWSKAAITGAASLDGLTIRTYDATSTEVFAAAGAKASNLSFADVMPRLKDGSVTAVLSSGDGGAGRKLWDFLPHFSAANYAFPLSFAFVGKAAFEALPEDQRRAVEEAARETEARQWAAMAGRLEQNQTQMRANGVTIAPTLPEEALARLRKGAGPAVERWAAKAGPTGAEVLKRFQTR